MKKNIFRPAWSFLDHLDESKVNQSFSYRVAQKKRPILFFIPKLCFTIFFPYFSGGVDSRPGRSFWRQYGSKWTLYYAAVDKNQLRRILPQNQFLWHSGNAEKILAGTMYLMEGQFNVWWPNFAREEVWQMLTKTEIVHCLA